MKNLLVFFVSAVSMFIISCSNDTNQFPITNQDIQLTQNGNKLRKAVLKNASGVEVSNQIYEYVGNKLSKIVFSDGSYNQFYYTGDLITKAEAYQNNSISSTGYYQYNTENKLAQKVSYSGNSGYKTTYVYNTDNTVTVTEYTGDLINQNTVYKTYKAFLNNNVMIKRENVNSGITYTKEYTYDTKNNPLNAILGYDKLIAYEVGATVCPNNLIRIDYSQSNTSVAGNTTNSIEYNSFNFPTLDKEYNNGTLNYIKEYYYEIP